MPTDDTKWVAVVSGIRSYDLGALALTASKAEGMAQLLGAYLAHRYNHSRGYAHPSQDRIAFDLKRSERAVRNMLTELVKTGEWYVVSGRGGTRSNLTMWSASRYYPTYAWLVDCIEQLRLSGATTTINRIVAQSTIFEVNETGARRATNLTLHIDLVPQSDQPSQPASSEDAAPTRRPQAASPEGAVTAQQSLEPYIPSILEGLLSKPEIESFLASSAVDRARAEKECETARREGYDLRGTLEAARSSARIRPTRYNGGVAKWVWDFALQRGVKESRPSNSGAWAESSSAEGEKTW